MYIDTMTVEKVKLGNDNMEKLNSILIEYAELSRVSSQKVEVVEKQEKLVNKLVQEAYDLGVERGKKCI